MLKFAIVGCGRISKNHFLALAENPDAEVIACADNVPERATEAAKTYGIPAHYSDYIEMLDKEKPDVLSICTPSGMHPEMGIEAARRGVHVVTEKPMAIRLEDADALVKACDHHNVHLFVVKQNRLNTTSQLLKRAIDKGRFGRLYLMQSNVFWQRPQSYYDLAKWRGTWEFDGGAFMNQASHYIDALHWLVGEVDYVLADTATMSRRIETEDTGCAILRFRNGIIASVNVTMLTYPKNFEGSITVMGEKGTVKLGGIAINRIDKWEFADYDDDDRIVQESNYQPPNVYGFGHLPYFNNVVDTLLGKAEPQTDGRDGRKSLEIIQAIYLSAKLGKKVSLPLER
ncbi:MAG: Gfo/Idh/MocA family oxidoreductase [Candidatus Cloacimonetes bacterium]|nr:Gfo/Idh/MocA family oxidoreductase [Candidatus Cloacimonadota bacterium]